MQGLRDPEGVSSFPKGWSESCWPRGGLRLLSPGLQNGLARSLFLCKLTSLPLERCRQATRRKQPSHGRPPWGPRVRRPPGAAERSGSGWSAASRKHGPGAPMNHRHPLHRLFGLGPECRLPTQAAKFGEEKSNPREAAAVQNETHLRRRGGQGAAAGPNGASSQVRFGHLP